MKKLCTFALVAGLFAIYSNAPLLAAELPTAEPAEVGLSGEKLAEIDQIMNGFMKDRKIAGGVVLVARHGKVAFHEPYGLMHMETGQTVDQGTIFRIYSMSKANNSAVALMLLDEGRLVVDSLRKCRRRPSKT